MDEEKITTSFRDIGDKLQNVTITERKTRRRRNEAHVPAVSVIFPLLPICYVLAGDTSEGLAQIGTGGERNRSFSESVASVQTQPSPARFTTHGAAFFAFIMGIAALVIFLSCREES